MRAYAIFAIFVVLLVAFAMLRHEPAERSAVSPPAVAKRVESAQQVLIRAEVIEISHTKLRQLGFGFATFEQGNESPHDVVQILSLAEFAQRQLRGDKVSGFHRFLQALKQDQLAKVLAEPTLVVTSGRPAHFRVGAESGGDGTAHENQHSAKTSFTGTEFDCLAVLQDDGKIALDCRMAIDRDRVVFDTKLALNSGETGVAGQRFTRLEASKHGDEVRQQENEIECLLLITPELVGVETAAVDNPASKLR